MEPWGAGEMELQFSSAPKLQHLFFGRNLMLEHQLSQSLALQLMRMGTLRNNPIRINLRNEKGKTP